MNALDGLLFTIIILLVFNYICEHEKKKKADDTEPDLPKISPEKAQTHYELYYERKNILTKSEYVFYSILKTKCTLKNMLICPKIRLEDFINVKSKNTKEKMKYRGYIKSRHVDFIICDSSLRIIGAIELDDPSHNSAKAQKTDEFKNELFKTIGIPLFRIRTGDNYENRIDDILNSIGRV